MKKIVIVSLVLMILTSIYCIELPKIHSSILLDGKFYNGGDSNTGLYDTSDRFQVRKAALAFEGNVSPYLTYEMEFGVSTCSGGGVDLKLMDATLEYDLGYNTQIGIQQGHVLRGFAGSTECSERLALEKPIFFTTYANCHPTGALIKTNQELPMDSELEVELAFMNGANGTYDGEYDYNYGLIYHTPLSGLALAAAYNHVGKKYYNDQFELYSKSGNRQIFGIQFENHGVFTTAEFYSGKGFETSDQEMQAYYLQLGYTIPVKSERLKYLQPYVDFESWDKHSENDAESEYTYLNAGLTFSLNEYSKFKVNYFTELSKPDEAIETPCSVIARLQISY